MRSTIALICLPLLGLWLAGCSHAPPVAATKAPTSGEVIATTATLTPLPSPAWTPTLAEVTPAPSSAKVQSGETPAGLTPTPSRQPPTATVAVPTNPPPAATAPAATSSPSATAAVVPTPLPTVALRTTQITIPTYPYQPYLRTVLDPTMGDYPVMSLDRTAYEASNPLPTPKTYQLLVLENAYLRLGILPELGGRLYEVTFKPTGNDELYHNPVIKPTAWGPPSPPYPPGANWWLAAGGIEFCFPVEEHGYEWATTWGYDQAAAGEGGIMLTLFTRDPRRPYVAVDIILPRDRAYFILRPRVINALGSDFRFQFWTNAMLAPGAANKPGPELRFILPTSEMTVHSTGDLSLPAAGQSLAWPLFGGRDMSLLGNWAQWLGIFERPAASGDFSGVYDSAADEGMVRIYPSDVARGSKAFAAGWSDPFNPSSWTDDGSGYVELQGGLTPAYDDWVVLPPGGEIGWSEIWYPVAGIGGVTHAEEAGAVYLAPNGDGLRVALFPTGAVRGHLTVTLPGMGPVVREVEIDPATPFDEIISYSEQVPKEGQVALELKDSRGDIVLSYRGQVQLR